MAIKISHHKIGPVNIVKTNGGWRVLIKGDEICSGLTFPQAKKLAYIELRKYELARLPLAMLAIPYDCKKKNLHTKLAPSQWKRLSRETYAAAGGICEICKASYPRLDCHEVWIYDDYRHIQKLSKLMAICFDCHRAIHFISGYTALLKTDSYERVKKHFLKVNRVKCKTMYAHEKLASWLYKKRDNYSWVVDFGDWAELVANSDRADVDKVRRCYWLDETGDGIVYTYSNPKQEPILSERITAKSITDFLDATCSIVSGAEDKIIRAKQKLTCSACDRVIPKGALYALRVHNHDAYRVCYDCLKDWQDQE